MIGLHLLIGMLTAIHHFDPLTIITAAQVTNGIVLPVLVLCLAICVNDVEIMKGNPQSNSWNLALFPCMTMTFFIAFRTIIDQIFRDIIDNDINVITMAFPLAAISVTPVTIFWRHYNARANIFHRLQDGENDGNVRADLWTHAAKLMVESALNKASLQAIGSCYEFI